LEGNVYQEMRDWDTQQAPLTAKRFAALKYMLSFEPQDVQVAPSVSIRKSWDERWLTAVLVLGAVTFLQCDFSDCCLRRMIGANRKVRKES
jgi:hypothetical protein